ncbi:MAG: CRISPR-associated helicase Cas3' [Lachnospiraceae bacterium]|nr:CRISPR-associated helicase Cas3' [Lachnospiraceae bacterium]
MPNQYAAHIDRENREQSVRCHCENTSAYAEENGSESGLSSTMRLVGLLHDCGKNTSAFDSYLRKAIKDPTSVRKGDVNHSSAGAMLIFQVLHDADETDMYSQFTAQLIAYAIMAHHGLMDVISPDGINHFEARLHPQKDNHYEEAVANSRDFLKEEALLTCFFEACDEIKAVVQKIQSYPGVSKQNGQFMFGCLQRMILSMLVDADRRDTAEFMDKHKTERINLEESFKCWEQYLEKLEKRLAGFDPSARLADVRAEMSEQCACFAENPDGIYRLSIPTGGGKTYAGMRYALLLAKRLRKKHIYYIAPFLSILEQNASDLKNVFCDEEHILEHHSNVIADEEDTEIRSSLQILEDDWSAPVILTTMVRFLEVLFGKSLQDIRRFHQLRNSVIILDEAQSVPIKCINMFNTMMNFLNGFFNTTVVICTATQPRFDICDQKLNYGVPADIISTPERFERALKRVGIEPIINQGRRINTEEFASFVKQHFDRSMLIILNTKAAVRMLYEQLRKDFSEDVRVVQLTTYMCAQHRMDVIEELKKCLKTERIICVSTQLIEAGVDISFQSVIRSLAGLDSIAQAAGRCNRNGELDGLGQVYLVDYAEEQLGSLIDIKRGKEATQELIDRYNGDLLSAEAVDLYYQKYYSDERRKMMNYIVKKEAFNLYDLLSVNTKGTKAMRHRGESCPKIKMMQAYKSAGQNFQPIEEMDTVGVIVPYRGAEGWIEQLLNAEYGGDIKKCLKHLQRYTVNINIRSKQWKEMMEKHAVKSIVVNKVFLLDSMYYTINGISYESSSVISEFVF